jgi:uncharacterized protein (TIGR02145 family)
MINKIHINFIMIFGLLMLITCSSSERTSNNEHVFGSITDPRDGKIYKTVKIGDQWIMAENFAFKPESGNYWAYNNDENNIPKYGYLYDWETAMDIPPDGWHLPSEKEWKAVRKSLGYKKETWAYKEKAYPELINGGSSGLDMLLGGIRTCDGEFKYLGDQARFWISTDSGSEKTYYGINSNKEGLPHGLKDSKAPYASYNEYQKSCEGYSVRLFKD